VLKPRSPALGTPQVLERGDDAGGGKRLALPRHPSYWIEADRVLHVGHIEVAHLVCSLRWDGVDDRLGKVAVRVDDRNSLPRHDVVHGQVEQDGAFARAGLADDIQVPLAFLAREHYPAADGVSCNDGWFRLHKSGAASGAKRSAIGGALATCHPALWSWQEVTRRACLVWRCRRGTQRLSRIVELRSLGALYRSAIELRCG